MMACRHWAALGTAAWRRQGEVGARVLGSSLRATARLRTPQILDGGAVYPVFVEITGRRARRVRVAGAVLALLCAAYGSLLVLSLLGVSVSPLLRPALPSWSLPSTHAEGRHTPATARARPLDAVLVTMAGARSTSGGAPTAARAMSLRVHPSTSAGRHDVSGVRLTPPAARAAKSPGAGFAPAPGHGVAPPVAARQPGQPAAPPTTAPAGTTPRSAPPSTAPPSAGGTTGPAPRSPAWGRPMPARSGHAVTGRRQNPVRAAAALHAPQAPSPQASRTGTPTTGAAIRPSPAHH